jgi:Kef-type K+ transport system membrane component KefB
MTARARHFVSYVVLMSVAAVLLLGILKLGPAGVSPSAPVAHAGGGGWLEAVQAEFLRNLDVPVVGLIVQVLAILVFARACSLILRMMGQPQVIGEMIAGILLGKSVFAHLWPEGFAVVFPEAAMPRLYFLSQIGLIFFMFTVGLHLKISELKERGPAAILISHMSIVVPFLLGTAAALGLYRSYGPANFDFPSFALFMGIALSITAFPVLARIIEEKRLTDTPLGAMALTCAAIDDVTAWCILAAVVGIVKAGTFATAGAVLAASLVYVVAMYKVVAPVVGKLMRPASLKGDFSRGQLGLLFCVLLGSALTAEAIGIHALFGAFLAGVIMPKNVSFRSKLIEKIEDLIAVVLLPIFFAYTGIRTEIGLLDSVDSWLVCLGITALAIAGKMAGSAAAARWSGMSWRESLALGSLLNTRGLMELVVLNIGYDIGILSPTLFAMMVIMALVTTTMTAPLLSLLGASHLSGMRSGGRS